MKLNSSSVQLISIQAAVILYCFSTSTKMVSRKSNFTVFLILNLMFVQNRTLRKKHLDRVSTQRLVTRKG